MTEEKTIEHDFTDEIVCCYCGHEFTNSWELDCGGFNETEVSCVSCSKVFYLYIEHSATYSTLKIEDKG